MQPQPPWPGTSKDADALLETPSRATLAADAAPASPWLVLNAVKAAKAELAASGGSRRGGDTMEHASSDDDDDAAGGRSRAPMWGGARAQQRGRRAKTPSRASRAGVKSSQQGAPEHLNMLQEEQDEEVNDLDLYEAVPWYKRPMVWMRITAFGLAVAMFITGVCIRKLAPTLTGQGGVEVYRWLIFFSMWPLIWVVVHFLMSQLFHLVEWLLPKRSHYMDTVRRTSIALTNSLLLLPWFVVMFKTAWCDQSTCDDPAFIGTTTILWRALVCFNLWCLANFLKAFIAKLVSSHFYKIVHVRKVNEAVRKEVFLTMLSRELRFSEGSDAAAHNDHAPPSQRRATTWWRPAACCGGGTVGAAELDDVELFLHNQQGQGAQAQEEARQAARDAAALKRFTRLVKLCKKLTKEKEERMMNAASTFGTNLFWNIKKAGQAAEMAAVEQEAAASAARSAAYGPGGNVVPPKEQELAASLVTRLEALKRDHLVRADFTPFFPSKEMADQAYQFFDADLSGDLSLKEVQATVVAIYQQRLETAQSLKDTDSIVRSLEFGIGFAIHFFFVAFYIVVWGIDFLKGFTTFSGTVLALTFVFGSSVRSSFEGLLFVFVEHPYDVGDWLLIDNVVYRVKQINLMMTVLWRHSGDVVSFPLSKMMLSPVLNLSRSGVWGGRMSFLVDVGPDVSSLVDAVNGKLKEFYAANEKDWLSPPKAKVKTMGDPLKVKLGLTYRMSATSTKRKSTRRTALLRLVQDVLYELGATCTSGVVWTDAVMPSGAATSRRARIAIATAPAKPPMAPAAAPATTDATGLAAAALTLSALD